MTTFMTSHYNRGSTPTITSNRGHAPHGHTPIDTKDRSETPTITENKSETSVINWSGTPTF